MLIADLHIHSRFSRATSRECDATHLDLWARRKGVGLVGTGDFTHPAWRKELSEALEEAGEGVFALKKELRLPCETALETRFVLSAEISSIYKRDGRTRKVHNVILMPHDPHAFRPSMDHNGYQLRRTGIHLHIVHAAQPSAVADIDHFFIMHVRNSAIHTRAPPYPMDM